MKKRTFFYPKLKTLSILTIFLSILTIFFSSSKKVLAERMESDSYIIQFGNFNMGSGEQNSTSYKLTETLGQIAAGPYGQYGSSSYFVGSGFQYIYQIKQFRFTISKTSIDLGMLTPDAHNTDSHDLNISTRGSGYVIYTYEARPLTLITNNNVTIPDTTCDDGSCDQTQASIWTDQNIGGFGFNINGNNVASDFVNQNYFRQFADRSSGESMQSIMSSNNIAVDDQATVTYKAGLTTGSQAAGIYTTYVAYVAVPTY